MNQNGNPITPTCELTGYTAETNDLNLGTCSPSSGEIVFIENNGNFATLTTSVASGQGSVSPNCPSPTSCQEPIGSSVSATATPSTEWQFSGWTISGSSCSCGSSVSPCQVTVTATAIAGWVFATWSTQMGISCFVNPCSFTMPDSPVTLRATFLQPTTISLSVTPSSTTVGSSVTLSGSISPNAGTVTVTISVSENSGQTYTTLMAITTSNSGTYSTTWNPPAPNNLQLRASWSGNNQFAASSSSAESLSVTGSSPLTPTILFPAPATVQHGQTATFTVTVFNPTSSQLIANVTIQIDGPNNYMLFDVIKVPVNANSQSSGYYDWAVPTQTGTYTATVSLLPQRLSGVDTETIQVM